jgi:hypothetical protein
MSAELRTLISSLSEANFRRLVQEFNKEKYNTPHVRIIDGPYDGGNDLEIIIGEKEVRKNIQVTVQKASFEKKLREDLVKAKENVQKYHYLNVLEFYINQSISKAKKNELEQLAEVDFGIKLSILDSSFLAESAVTYGSIKKFTYQFHDVATVNTAIADEQTKVLFDVLTLNSDSVEIKRNFIHSYILSFLFANPDSTIDEVHDYINNQLKNTIQKHFIEGELNFLRSKKHLESQQDKSRFRISNEKREEIQTIFSDVLTQEQALQQTVQDFITNNRLGCTSSELLDELYKIYQENYRIDIDEVKNTGSSFDAAIRKSFNDLIQFFAKQGIGNSSARLIAKDLLRLCNENTFLSKLSSIHLFNDLYSSEKLEKYLSSKRQFVLLDTQILIRYLIVLFDEKHNYEDAALQSVGMLLKVFEQFKARLSVASTYDYVGEVAGHLLEAIKLQRFLSLPYIAKLGKSKNVFYNAFIELKTAERIDAGTEFSEFVVAMLGEEPSGNDGAMIAQMSKRISSIFALAGIELIYHESYPNFPAIKKEYEVALAYSSKTRNNNALENDLRTILYLSSSPYHVNSETGELNEPFLVTWDSAFYEFRREVLERHKDFTYWYIYSPAKAVDRFSVMNFSLNPKSISFNIIALTETNFNYSTRNASFLDVISSFFHSTDVSRLSIIQRLADLKDETREIKGVQHADEFGEHEDKVTSLLLNLKNHYFSYESKFRFDDVIQVFEAPKFESDIMVILKKTLHHFDIDHSFKVMYAAFDRLIEDSKKAAEKPDGP